MCYYKYSLFFSFSLFQTYFIIDLYYYVGIMYDINIHINIGHDNMIFVSEIDIVKKIKGRENRNENFLTNKNCIKMLLKFSHFQEHQECLNFQQVL